MISIASQTVSSSTIARTVSATAVAVVALLAFSAAPARAEGVDAVALWAKHCASCHGKDGKVSKAGEKMGVQDLTSAAVKAGLTKTKVSDSMTKGVKAKDSDKMVMKAYTDKLSAAEIEALTDYTLALK